ncbi:MAG: hypothetical protein JNM33_12960 [Rubrivivax sp.]|nr:hypothetical protein [Rubrivivax sp.]
MENDPKRAEVSPSAEKAVEAETLSRKQVGRRTLLRAGAGAAPVLLALRSGPVGATGQSCVVASSFVSVTTFKSRNAAATTLQCTSYNYDHWRGCVVNSNLCPGTDTTYWPAWTKKKISTQVGCTGTGYDNETVGAFLKNRALAGTGKLAVLQRILALTLTIDNAGSLAPSGIQTAGAPGGTLTKLYLQGVLSSYLGNAGGNYVVAASGINWPEATLIDWLQRLQNPIAI